MSPTAPLSYNDWQLSPLNPSPTIDDDTGLRVLVPYKASVGYDSRIYGSNTTTQNYLDYIDAFTIAQQPPADASDPGYLNWLGLMGLSAGSSWQQEYPFSNAELVSIFPLQIRRKPYQDWLRKDGKGVAFLIGDGDNPAHIVTVADYEAQQARSIAAANEQGSFLGIPTGSAMSGFWTGFLRPATTLIGSIAAIAFGGESLIGAGDASGAGAGAAGEGAGAGATGADLGLAPGDIVPGAEPPPIYTTEPSPLYSTEPVSPYTDIPEQLSGPGSIGSNAPATIDFLPTVTEAGKQSLIEQLMAQGKSALSAAATINGMYKAVKGVKTSAAGVPQAPVAYQKVSAAPSDDSGGLGQNLTPMVKQLAVPAIALIASALIK